MVQNFKISHIDVRDALLDKYIMEVVYTVQPPGFLRGNISSYTLNLFENVIHMPYLQNLESY